MRLTAVNRSSYIGGAYVGRPVIVISAKANKSLPTNIQLTGKINLILKGVLEVFVTPTGKRHNVRTELYPGDPFVDIGEYLAGDGVVELSGEGSAGIRLFGPNVLPDAGQEGTSGATQTHDCHVVICSKGTFLHIQGVGTSDTSSSGSSDFLGSILNMTSTGWSKDDIPGEIPEYTRGEVIRAAGDEKEYTILIDNTSEGDLQEYLKTLADNGWYTSEDYASWKNISLHFDFNRNNQLQMSVYVHELGTWPADEVPADIVPPEKGTMIGEVEIYHDSRYDRYDIIFVYDGLTEDDVYKYMELCQGRGWEGDEYIIDKIITWKGKRYRASIEPMFDRGDVVFYCTLFRED